MKAHNIRYIGVGKTQDDTRSGAKGRPLKNPFFARIKVQGKATIIGYYPSAIRAALAYDEQALKMGRKTNFLK